jgi:hypothetical protein
LNGTLFVQRPGGATYHASPLNAAFLDQHESWYAVHWTTPFLPDGVADLCLEVLGLSIQTCAIIQSAKEGIVQAPLGDLRWRFLNLPPEDTTLFRLDAQDYVIIWEQSGEYERLRSAREYAPFTAILGFGTDRFDPEFGSNLLRRTATSEISGLAESIWRELGFLGDEFKRVRIDPSRGYND